MKPSVRKLLVVISAIALGACAEVWAGSIAKNVANGLGSIRSYRGATIEKGLAEIPIERSVLYAKGGLVRVETTTPGAHQGELFIYDGQAITLWSPQALFGVRIRGIHAPSATETLHHIERLTKTNLDAYTFALEDEGARVVGQRAMQWRVRPARRAPLRFEHRVWNQESTTLPLKMEFTRDGQALWYSFAYSELAFDVPIAPDAFAFAFPKNAVVFEWDLDAPGISLAEAREEMNFKVEVPGKLPAGHAIQKIVRSPHCLPMIVIAMDHDGTMMSLVESRAGFSGDAKALGIGITVGGQPATLAFLGAFTTITWVKDGTQLALTSNLDFPSLVAVAESVE
ncbi:hypothetical protein BH11MYX1_BH11MYX1_26430 [soil metagenome]